MWLVVNGVEARVPAGATVAGLVEERGADPAGRGVAVALNGEVVPREAWGALELAEGDRIEILHAVGGG